MAQGRRRHLGQPLLVPQGGGRLSTRGGPHPLARVDQGARMRVATWRGGERFTIDEAPEPFPGPGQVVVAVEAAGICGTDIHATQGLFPWSPPLVLGHEYTGVVRAVGRGVPKRLIGRAVACEPSYGCGECAECDAGRISQCPRATRVGGFAERVTLPAHCVHPLPRGLDPVAAALTEPAACCLAGLEKFSMERGATVLVIGVSPKGSEVPLSLWDVHFREIRIAGAFGRGTAFRRALALMPSLGVGRLITASFPLARTSEAFAHASAGRGAKTVIMPAE